MIRTGQKLVKTGKDPVLVPVLQRDRNDKISLSLHKEWKHIRVTYRLWSS
jgi:predicted RNA-binding protein with RPS1 domain